jgi:hypothetical protein
MHELRVKRLGGLLLKLDFEKAYDRVNWDFLQEVLLRKGFSAMVVHRLMQLVRGSQTAINVNGEVGPFFRNTRGVRQGDPLSPILFDFLVDALAAMLAKANSAGHIKGVVSHLIPGGVTHLQYADDTVILIEPTDLGIANLKFLLLCFENMSGLKINFDKSEVLVTGVLDEEKRRLANLLNCKLGTCPTDSPFNPASIHHIPVESSCHHEKGILVMGVLFSSHLVRSLGFTCLVNSMCLITRIALIVIFGGGPLTAETGVIIAPGAIPAPFPGTKP